MKKIIILLVFSIIGSYVMAQSPKVQSAYNYLKNGKLDKAKEAIDAAAENETTKDKAKTWFYLGNIYLNIYISQDEEYKKLSDNALEIAYDAYKKTKVMDEKGEYSNELQINLLIVAEQFYNKAVSYFNEKEYLKSHDAFLTSKEVNEGFGGVDSLATFNGAICAEYGGDTAEAVRLYSYLIGLDYDQPALYASLANIYKGLKEYDKGLEVVKMGRDRYPYDFSLIISETNLFLAIGDSGRALEDLQIALTIEKNNPTIYFAVGSQYNIIVDDTSRPEVIRKEAFTFAEDAYRKALELDTEYFDASYNLGALYVNMAAEIIKKANALPLGDSKYDPLKEEADMLLQNAVPQLEKAVSVKPDDINTLFSLKEIYTRLGMYEQLKGINAKIEELNQ